MIIITVAASIILLGAGLLWFFFATRSTTVTEAKNETFRFEPWISVGGFCSIEATDHDVCIEGVSGILADYKTLYKNDNGTLKEGVILEVNADVTKTTSERTNSANPPESKVMETWHIGKVYSVRAVTQ